jgi:hypothetical protein
VFISEEGDVFTAYAEDVWQKISTTQSGILVIRTFSPPDVKPILDKNTGKAEEILGDRYMEMERTILQSTERIKNNKQNSYEFQVKQLNKIGIENIRESRIQKLEKEKYNWEKSHELQKEIIPELKCLLIMKVLHE